jgi:hypothetical protein
MTTHDDDDDDDDDTTGNHLTSYVSLSWELDALAKLRKATTNSVVSLSLRPSVCPHETSWFPTDRFSRNLIFEYFTKICRENSSLIKTWQD